MGWGEGGGVGGVNVKGWKGGASRSPALQDRDVVQKEEETHRWKKEREKTLHQKEARLEMH